MGSVDRKLGLLENIARLRRTQRRVPEDRDIAAVRSELERELGSTVSRRLAARFLGVSHTALNRWVDAGDLPLVYNVDGRREVPVSTLLELGERVAAERERGRGRGHPLEAVMAEGRDAARRMRVEHLIPGQVDREGGHGSADRRAMAYHRAVARRLSRSVVDEALYKARKWCEEGKLDPSYAQQWEEVLARPLDEVRDAISEDSTRGRDLRQNSPFAGVLSEPERRKIVQGIR